MSASLIRQFSGNTGKKECLASLIIKEMQIRTLKLLPHQNSKGENENTRAKEGMMK